MSLLLLDPSPIGSVTKIALDTIRAFVGKWPLPQGKAPA